MSDLIDREQALSAFDTDDNELIIRGSENADNIEQYLKRVMGKIENLPSAEEESFEWCTDCKEYDQEKHCCHRWTKVIRNTVEELRVVRCKDCKYAEYMDDVQSLWCTECGNGRTVAPYDFCSYGERRTDG